MGLGSPQGMPPSGIGSPHRISMASTQVICNDYKQNVFMLVLKLITNKIYTQSEITHMYE